MGRGIDKDNEPDVSTTSNSNRDGTLNRSSKDKARTTPKEVYHPVIILEEFNWPALTKEAYVIYLSARKLSFYITNADAFLRYDHLPLKTRIP